MGRLGMNWIDLTPDLTEEGQQRVNVGEVLIFKQNDVKTYLKIMRKHKGKVWAKEIYLYRPDQIQIKDKVE
jgi:hypothetical protein